MSDIDLRIVIVGAGQAGGRAVLALRQSGFDGAISLIGDERDAPYERPLLSKAVLAGAEEAPTPVLTVSQLQEHRVNFLPGCRVTALDTTLRQVQLSDGRTLGYDRCLLATGGRARALPGLDVGSARIHSLRTSADAARLRDALQPGRRLVLLGGGFLGLEAAATAAGRGGSVTVIERNRALLDRFLPDDASDWLAGAMRQRGVSLKLGAGVDCIDVDDAGVHVSLDGATVDADDLLVAVGLTPNTELARNAGLSIDPVNGGIAVDHAGRTSAANVYAAGDCASQYHPHLSCTLRLESWQNANVQAETAAASMLGRTPAPAAYPWFWSDVAGHNLQMLGMAEPGLRYVRRGDLPGHDGSGARVLWIGHRDDIPVHGIALNAGADLRALRPLFEQRCAIDPAAFSAATTPLRPWARSTLAASTPSSDGAPRPVPSPH